MSRRQSLRELLVSHQPADDVESCHLRAMLELLGSDADPFSRRTFDPGHFTASAFVLSPTGELLMVLHRRLERWLQPGGHIDPEDGDTCTAALREVEEETGIAAVPGGCRLLDVDVHQIPESASEPLHRHFDVRFLFHGSGPVQPRAEVADARWVPIGEVERLETDESVRRALEKLR